MCHVAAAVNGDLGLTLTPESSRDVDAAILNGCKLADESAQSRGDLLDTHKSALSCRSFLVILTNNALFTRAKKFVPNGEYI